MTPPLQWRQAITCTAMPIVAAGWRWWQRQCSSNVQLSSATVVLSLAAQRRHLAWQCGRRAAAARRHWGMATQATTNAVLQPRTAVVAMKTPAATAMVGAQTINNQLKARKQ